MVHDVVATPFASVTTFELPTLPPPSVGANVTVTFAAGLLKASRNRTAGASNTGLPTPAFWLSPATFVSVVGGPDRAVALKLTELTTPFGSANKTFCVPAVVPSVQFTCTKPFAPDVSAW